MTDSESSHHSDLPPYGFLLYSISFPLYLPLQSNGAPSLDLCSGVPAEAIFLRYPLITHHLVFMAQVFITTLLIAHWLKDEDFPPRKMQPEWNYPH